MDDQVRQDPSGGTEDEASRATSVLARYPRRDPGDLVNILHDLQAEFRYLPEAAMRDAAAHVGLPEAQVYGVATFYHGFHIEPRGEHTCTVCMGTACHVRGAPRLLEQLERDTGVAAGRHGARPLAHASRRSAASARAHSARSCSSTASTTAT